MKTQLTSDLGRKDMKVSPLDAYEIPRKYPSRGALKQYAQERFGVSLDARMTLPNMLSDLETQLENKHG
ncbi:hypothetical protein ACPV5S_15540 [Vibrio astriarenae]